MTAYLQQAAIQLYAVCDCTPKEYHYADCSELAVLPQRVRNQGGLVLPLSAVHPEHKDRSEDDAYDEEHDDEGRLDKVNIRTQRAEEPSV